MPAEIIGREEELAAIAAFLDEGAGADGPCALLIEGEPGIGKTTVWRAGVAAGLERGGCVLEARPAASEAELSFAGLADLFGHVLEDILPALPPPQHRALEIALLRVESAGAPPDRRTIGAAVLGVLRALADAGPVIVAIDDLQWLDAESAFALGFAVRRLRAERILLVYTVMLEKSGAARELLHASHPDRLERIRLGTLSAGAISHMLRRQLGVAFPRPLARGLYETSGGNPLFALELGRAVLEHGGRIEVGEGLPVEGDLDQLVRARVVALPDSTRTALAAASASPQAGLAALNAIIEDVETALGPAVEAGVVELDGERIRFTHPLLAAGVYGALGPADRRALHRRLAETTDDPVERARHLARSTSTPDAAVAEALDAGARAAAARGAPQAAAELAERAWRLTPPADVDRWRRRRLQAADRHFHAGDVLRVRTLLDEALAERPPGSARAEVLMRLAELVGSTGRVTDAIALLETAFREAPDDDLELRSGCLQDLSVLTRVTQGLETAERHARAAVELAEGTDNPSLLARALRRLARIEFNAARASATATVERSVALARQSSDVPARDDPNVELAHQLLWSGEFAAARMKLEHMLESRAGRDEASECSLLWYLSLAESRAGSWDSAAEHADALVELETQCGWEWGGTYSPQALVAAYRGDVDRARAILAHSLALAEASGDRTVPGMHRAILGFLELSCGNVPAALEELRSARAIGEELGVREPGMPFGLDDYLEALVAAGEIEHAATLLEPWAKLASELDRAAALARAERVRGLLSAGRGDLVGAVSALERALAHHERGPEPLERGRTLLALGQVQRRANQRRASRETLRAALTVFEELGAARWAQRARAELARIGGRAPSAGELTPMERRVAELVASGLSNRETAAELVVAVRTVETHLSRIYRKLGVRSRAQLATRMTEEALTRT